MGDNEARLIGNLPRDPVVRATKRGKTYAYFSVATNDSYIDRDGGVHEITYYPSVIVWGDLAEAVGNLCSKGSRVQVEGRIQTRSYDTPDGQRKYVQELVARRIWVPLQGTKQKQGTGNFQQFGEQPAQQPASSGDDAPFPAAPPQQEEDIPF